MSEPDLQSNDRDTDKKVWVFLGLAFGISWGAFAIRRAVPWTPVLDETLRLTVKFGPSLAGMIATAAFGGLRGLADLLGRLKVPMRHPRWLAIAFGLPMVILIAARPIRAALGGSLLPLHSVGLGEGLAAFGTLMATRFFLGGGLGEELGWRGFMLPVLQSRVGALSASVVIGLAHGAWHLPAYGAGAIFLTLFTVSGAILFTWMYNNTEGNLFLPALMHATANASLPFLERIVPAIDGEIGFPLVVFLLWAAVALFVLWRQGGAGLEPPEKRIPRQVHPV